MAFRIEIIQQSLVITDTSDSSIVLDRPKSEIFYSSSQLDAGRVELFSTSNTAIDPVRYSAALADTEDSGGATFTATTFRTFARTNLGFSSASGGSGAGRTTVLLTGSPFATFAALETAAQANLSQLHNDETQVGVAVVTDEAVYQWAGADTPGIYTSSWIVRESLLSLTAAQQTELTNLLGITNGTVPLKTASGYADSAISETDTEVIITKSLQVPGESLTLGSIRLSNAAQSTRFVEQAENRVFFPLLNELNATTGSLGVFTFDFGPPVDFPSNADQSETLTGTSIQFSTPSILSGITNSFTFNSTVATSEVNIIIRLISHTNDPAVFDYLRDLGTTVDLSIGDNAFDIPLFFESGQDLFVTISSPNNLSLTGQTLSGQPTPYYVINGHTATKQTFDPNAERNVQANWDESDNSSDAYIQNKPTIPTARTDEEIRDIIGATLVAGTNVSINVDDANNTITISSTGGSAPGPVPSATDLRYGLSSASDPSLVNFASLTDEATPTNPITISTGTTTAGQYFHIYSTNTHEIQTITDTVLSQIVYQDGGTGNIFTKTEDARTEGSITYDAYSVGPLNAGVDEEYVIQFS